MRALLTFLLFSTAASAQGLAGGASASGEAPQTVLVLVAPEAIGAGAVDEAFMLFGPGSDVRPEAHRRWSGGKIGAAIGFGVGAVPLAVAVTHDLRGGCTESFVCASHLAAARTVVLTGMGYVIGRMAD